MNRVTWTPKPTERVLIEHLPAEFVREIDEHLDKHGPFIPYGMALRDAPLFRIAGTFPQLTTKQCAELWVEWIQRHDARKSGRGIAGDALADATQFTAEERAEIRREVGL